MTAIRFRAKTVKDISLSALNLFDQNVRNSVGMYLLELIITNAKFFTENYKQSATLMPNFFFCTNDAQEKVNV